MMTSFDGDACKENGELGMHEFKPWLYIFNSMHAHLKSKCTALQMLFPLIQ